MEIFSALLAFCAGNSPVTGEFPAQRPVTRSFDVFFELRLNKRLSKLARLVIWDAIAPIMTSPQGIRGLFMRTTQLSYFLLQVSQADSLLPSNL